MAKRVNMRDKMRDKLKERTKESHKNRDSGSGIKNYFNDEQMSEVTTWWAGKGDHIIDVIPYFAGVHDPRNKEGEPAYVLDVEVHRAVGPMEEMVVCPEQFGDLCPICEESRKRSHEGADYKKDIKPLKAGRRVMYNIVVRDGGEMEKKGVQVFEIAHWFMEKHLAKISKDPRGGGFTVFSDPDEGKSVSFERTGTGAENTGYSGHRFVDRPEPITDDELDSAHCLDDLIEIKDYDEIYEIFHGKESDNKESDVQPAREEPEAGAEAEPEVEAGAEAEPEVELTAKEKAAKRKKAKRARAAKKKTVECPHGGIIGEDIDELDECDACAIYDQCNDVADTL